MKLHFEVMGFVLLAMLAGCRFPTSPREAFLIRTADRAHYHKLYEVSFESIRDEEDRLLRLTQDFARSTREVIGNCPSCPSLVEGLARIERTAHGLHGERMDLLRQIEAAYDRKTDAILFFHYWAPQGDDDAGSQEWGYLITRGGILKKKFVTGGGPGA